MSGKFFFTFLVCSPVCRRELRKNVCKTSIKILVHKVHCILYICIDNMATHTHSHISIADPHFKTFIKVACYYHAQQTASNNICRRTVTKKSFHTNWDFFVCHIFKSKSNKCNCFPFIFSIFTLAQTQYFVCKLSLVPEIEMKFVKLIELKRYIQSSMLERRVYGVVFARGQNDPISRNHFPVIAFCFSHFHVVFIAGNDLLSLNFPLHTSIIRFTD